MIDVIRYFWKLALLACLLVLAGILILPRLVPELSLNHYLFTVLACVLINMVAWLIMYRAVHQRERGAGDSRIARSNALRGNPGSERVR